MEKNLYINKIFKFNIIRILSVLLLIVLFTYKSNGLEFNDNDNNNNDNNGQTILKSSNNKKKNIIMMVTDGTGPSSINMARYYNQFINNSSDINELLTLDNYLIGQSRTKSSSSLITDSAAGATAFSCGLKSYNGAIGVDSFKRPCGTILEALKLKGYKTGLVVTTSLTDATPAAFSSHVEFRNMEDLIAMQQLGINSKFGNTVDLMIGGGKCFFLPNSDLNSCRNDEINLIEYARDKNWEIILNKEEFNKLEFGLNENFKLPLISLLSHYNLPYEIDRDEEKFPSLYEQTKTALNLLSRETKDSDEGFFLLIEGSRIDHAGHHNDPQAQVRELLAYDKAFNEVIEFAKNSEIETYIISTSDHETGGLDIGRQINQDIYPEYIWHPEILFNAKHSGEFLNLKINKFLQLNDNNNNNNNNKLKEFIINEILIKDLGIKDFNNNELKIIMELLKIEQEGNEKLLKIEKEEEKEIQIQEVNPANKVVEFLKDMVSRRALIGWSTHGHTAADVNVYGYCNKEEGMNKIYKYIGGSIENTEIGKFLEFIGEVNLKEISEQLN